MKQERIDFFSEGIKLAGLLHLPDSSDDGTPRPAVIFSHGYTGSKEGQTARHAAPLVAAGYACLTFDHRGFGESEGTRGRMILDERVRDLTSAILFMRQQPQVDTERIGLYGLSVGAAIVLLGAQENNIKCVVTSGAFGDGERWLASLRRYWEWREFRERVEQDRANRVLNGKSDAIDALEIVLPPPDMQAHYAGRRSKGNPAEWTRTLESADSIIQCKPETVVDSLAPCAVMFVHGGGDNLVPPEQAHALYVRAREPKRLLIVPGATHEAMYLEPVFSQVAVETGKFFDEFLK